MPYIKPETRARLDVLLNALISEIRLGDEPDGEVNYSISRVASGVLIADKAAPRYRELVRVVGAFQAACLEFYRRMGTKLEDRAILRNGDTPEYME